MNRVFDKAASIRGAVAEIDLIVDDLLKENGDDYRAMLQDIRRESATIERLATDLQDPDPTASLPERFAFLAALFHSWPDTDLMVARTYVTEKIGFALKPERTVMQLRGALDRQRLEGFEAMVAEAEGR